VKKLFSKILGLFTQNEPQSANLTTPDANEPLDAIALPTATITHQNPAYKWIEEDTTIKDLIDQLDYLHTSKQRQAEKRLKAFTALGDMGSDAKQAIPALIGKHFAFDSKEITLARETLYRIDSQWFTSDLANNQVDFLIKKLDTDHGNVSRAVNMLKLMGQPAQQAVLKSLSQVENENTYFQLNALKFLGENLPLDTALIPILNNIIQTSENVDLLDISCTILGDFEEVNDEVISNIAVLLNNKIHSVRANAINAIKNLNAINENIIIGLLSCLSDDYPEVRENSIATLSKIDHILVDDYCRKIVACKGIIGDDELKEIFRRIALWHRTDIKISGGGKDQYWDSIFWFNLDIKKHLAKPEIVLNGVLRILVNKKQSYPDLTPLIIDICKTTENENIQACAIYMLENVAENKNEVVTFLISRLNTPSQIVRKANVSALNNLEKEWLQNPETLYAINEIIDQLDTSDKKMNMEYLAMLGDGIIPFLIQRLEKTEKRTIQKAIIEALNYSGDGIKSNLATLETLKDKFSDAHNSIALNDLIKKIEK
jgi:HEAT repeat protein